MEAIYQAIIEKRQLHLITHKGKIASHICQMLKLNGKTINTITISQLDYALDDDKKDNDEKDRLIERVCKNCLNSI